MGGGGYAYSKYCMWNKRCVAVCGVYFYIARRVLRQHGVIYYSCPIGYIDLDIGTDCE